MTADTFLANATLVTADAIFPGGLATYTAVTGAPILADNLGHLDCVVNAAHQAGDHTIYVAEVVSAAVGAVWAGGGADGHDHGSLNPLLYFDRGYHRLD